MARILSSIVVVLGLPLLLLGNPAAVESRIFPYAWDFGHVLLFAALAWLVCSMRPAVSRLPNRRLLPLALAAVLLVSLPIEGIQYLIGREASGFDILRNAIGALLGLAFRPHRQLRRLSLRATALQIGAAALGIAALLPLLLNAVDKVQADGRFPVLSDMEAPFEVTRWEGARLARKNFGGPENHVLRADFSAGEFSSIKLNLFDSDWRGYAELRFRIYSFATENTELHLRINDSHHADHGREYDDRFNRVLTLEPGWNRFSIAVDEIRRQPENRAMDLAAVDNISFFTYRQTRGQTYYFDDIELKP